MRIIRKVITATLMAVTVVSTSSCYVRISKEFKERVRQETSHRELMREVVYSENDSLVYHLGDFSKITLDGWVDARFVTKDGEPEVVVKGTTRTRDSILVANTNGNLTISYGDWKGVAYTSDEEVIIYAPSINSIYKMSSGDLDFEGTMLCDSLDILCEGSGDIHFDRFVVNGPLKISKSGSGDIEGLAQALDVRITAQGSGDIELGIKNSKSVSIQAEGSGDITLDGDTKDLVVAKSGSGDLDLSELDATSATVTKTGSGDMTYRLNGKVIESED